MSNFIPLKRSFRRIGPRRPPQFEPGCLHYHPLLWQPGPHRSPSRQEQYQDRLPETVQWYREKSMELEKEQGGKKPGIAFMHIAPPEYMYIYNVLN